MVHTRSNSLANCGNSLVSLLVDVLGDVVDVAAVAGRVTGLVVPRVVAAEPPPPPHAVKRSPSKERPIMTRRICTAGNLAVTKIGERDLH